MDHPLGFDGTATLALGVRDRTAAAAWYMEHLGFELLYDAPAIGWCEMSTPVGGMNVGFADREQVVPGGPVPTLTVVDVASARTRLEAGGVRFEGETVVHDGLVRLATFLDPDGHAWMLAESLAGAPGSGEGP